MRRDMWVKHYERVIGKLINKLRISENDIVVDVGCGNRRFKRFVKGKYIGLDREPSADVQCDLNKDFPVEAFDKALLILVLELVDHRTLLKKISTTISSKGRLLITIPNFDSEHYRIWRAKDLKRKDPTSRYQHHISDTEMKEELCGNEFQILETNGIIWYPYSKGFSYPRRLRFLPVLMEAVGREPSYFYYIAEKKNPNGPTIVGS